MSARYIPAIGLAGLVAFAQFAAALAASADSLEDRGTALLQALRNADDTEAYRLIDRREGLNASDESGATPLMWAAQCQNAELTRRLLQAGADPNIRDRDGVGPLQIALETQATDVALLLAHRTDANAMRKNGETVLMTAARNGQLEVMRLLIARGADVNARENKFHQTALMWSAGYREQVKLLIAHGADVHARSKSWDVTNTNYSFAYSFVAGNGVNAWDNSGEFVTKEGGQSALFFAVQADDFASVKALLDAEVSPDEPAADGSTALLRALYKWKNRDGDPRSDPARCLADFLLHPGPSIALAPNLRIANLLLDRGGKVNVSDPEGYTPLHGATLSLVPVSRFNPCGPELKTQQGKRLEIAVTSKTSADPAEAIALVKRLLDLGADPNAVTRFHTPGPATGVRINPEPIGSSALHIAAESGNADLVKLLLDHGADPNLVNESGHSSLSTAVEINSPEVVELLLAHGGTLMRSYNPSALLPSPVEKEPPFVRSKQTLLHIAAAAGAYNVVRYLVARGMSLDAKNDQGETPLDLADLQELARWKRDRGRALGEAAFLGRPEPDKSLFVRETNTTDVIKAAMRAGGDAKPRRPPS